MLVFRIISNRIYDIHVSLIRELHNLLTGKAKNLDIVLYIQKGTMNDKFIKEYFKSEQMDENFTIIRTRDELNFMMGSLYTNSNKIVYASEFKHSISQDIYCLMNPDPKSKNRKFKHINIKELFRKMERTEFIKMLQKIMPEAVNSTEQGYLSKPKESKQKLVSFYIIYLW